MNKRIINIGYLFARPHESAYAIVRRILSVNPGLTYSDIDDILRASQPNQRSPYTRLSALTEQNHDVTSKYWLELSRASYKRQCPICASELYHTDIYALDWLARCPIHNKAFISRCSECGKPWPALRDIDKRDCPSCGRVSLEYLRNTVLPAASSLSYQSIEKLYSLVDHGMGDDELIIRDPDGAFLEWPNWLEIAQPTSKYYAALMTKNHSTFSHDDLVSSGIHIHEVKTQSTRIRAERHNFDVTQDQIYRTPKLKQAPSVWRKSIRRMLDSDFAVMQSLVAWSEAHSIPPHNISIDSYRHLGNDHFTDGPRPCVFCLALSVWFFHVMARHYAEYVADDINNYPFLADNMFKRPLSGFEPEIIVGGKRYRPDESFTKWFYQRGLLLSFIEIMDHACATRITSDARIGDDWKLEVQSTLDRSYLEKICLGRVSKGHLDFHYLNDNILEHYELPWQYLSGRSCHVYQQFHTKYKRDNPESHIASFDNKAFDKSAFDATITNFDIFIDKHYGSLPAPAPLSSLL